MNRSIFRRSFFSLSGSNTGTVALDQDLSWCSPAGITCRPREPRNSYPSTSFALAVCESTGTDSRCSAAMFLSSPMARGAGDLLLGARSCVWNDGIRP